MHVLLTAALASTGWAGSAPASLPEIPIVAASETLLIEDFSRSDGKSALGTRWSAVSDRVMGGVSDVQAVLDQDDRPHVHMVGIVREVPGYGSAGFVQIGLDLEALDASAWTGIRLMVRGDGQTYGAHLRTRDVKRPWQSWRGSFVAGETWTEVTIAFEDFEAYRIDTELDTGRLERLSLIAVDRTGTADLRVAEVSLYR